MLIDIILSVITKVYKVLIQEYSKTLNLGISFSIFISKICTALHFMSLFAPVRFQNVFINKLLMHLGLQSCLAQVNPLWLISGKTKGEKNECNLHN